MFSRVIGDLHDVELQTFVALPDAVDASDVRTRLVHRFHQLLKRKAILKKLLKKVKL